MWQERQAELLREEMEAFLAPLSDATGLYNLLKESLNKDIQRLSNESGHSHYWPLLPLIVCEAISGRCEHAIPAAATLQLIKAAAEVFDDIEDADSSESLSTIYGSAVATNVATTLLILAEKGITRLKGKGVEDYIIVYVMDTINSFYTTASVGQHLDLSRIPGIAVSEDAYLETVGMKSASTVECACCTGALLATANQELIDTFVLFGHNLGMAAQIANDVLGITSGSDIMKSRITLPIIYALTQTGGKARNKLESAFGKQPESKPDTVQIRDLLFRSGAIHYATIKMEFYKQQALAILLEAEEAGVNVKRLKLFLE